MKFTHLTESGAAHMVDVSAKAAHGAHGNRPRGGGMFPPGAGRATRWAVPKGDVLAVARVAGIAAAKKVPDLLPLAHTIGVHGCQVDLEICEDHVTISATVTTADRTGVEMEALTAVTVAALTVIDMVKGVDRSAVIRRCGITAKSGGRSGDWSRELP